VKVPHRPQVMSGNRPSMKPLRGMVAAAAALLLAGCGDAAAPTPPLAVPPPAAPTPDVVSRIDVSAAATTLTPSQSVPFSAVARTAAGATVAGVDLVWSSSAPTVATVNVSGLVVGVAAGTATIRATLGAVVGSLDVTVTSGAGVLSTVVVSAQDRTVQLGQTTQATVGGRDALGATVALGTRTVTWSTSNTAIASITAAGVVTGVGIGTVELRASVADGAVPRTASVPLTVNSIPGAPSTIDVFMPGLTFSPIEAIVRQGGTVRFIFPALVHNVIWDRRFAGAPTNIATTSNVTVTRTFPTVGVFAYTCTLHPGMDGTVVVSP
jgi:plastocyanin